MLNIIGLNISAHYCTDNKADLFPHVAWSCRKTPMIEYLKSGDIIFFCEASLNQVYDLINLMPDYNFECYASETKMSISELEITDNKGLDLYNGTFVGCGYKKEIFSFKSSKLHILPKGKKHERILTEIHLEYDNKEIICLGSHFDHLSFDSRSESGKYEIELINNLLENGYKYIISYGDRNWFSDQNGDELYNYYTENAPITDISMYNHVGPQYTFIGYTFLPKQFQPIEEYIDGKLCYKAENIDIMFVSKGFVVNKSENYIGLFDPNNGFLIDQNNNNLDIETYNYHLKNRHVISDHLAVNAQLEIIE